MVKFEDFTVFNSIVWTEVVFLESRILNLLKLNDVIKYIFFKFCSFYVKK